MAFTILAFPGVASATTYPTAYLRQTDQLSLGDPTFYSPHCITRTIDLASGTYAWNKFITGVNLDTRLIWLGAGPYTWTVCNALETSVASDYTITSYLTPRSGGTATSAVVATIPFNGSYTWGASLARTGD
ncbi:hypothetical protein ABZX90_10640 [Streptomyces sp. NPDC002935]|uniref:hypothetical protein n=1 Tax=Streptomyces sp. NPDC002935 TaxID=3154545 RepID=UPI0033BA5039